MGNLSDLLKNPTSQVDTVAALVEAVLLDEQASGSNLASNLAGGGVGSVPIQSGPNATTFVASPTTSGHKFLLGWTPSGAAIEPAAIDAASLGTLATGSSATPIVDGTGAPGTSANWAHGDHVHPTDTSRVGGSGTAGKLPLFSDSETLENSPVDVGLTFADTIFIDATGVDGAPSCASIGAGAGGVYIDAVADGVHAGSADGKILVVSGKGLQLMNIPKNSTGSSVLVVNGDTGGLSLDGGAGGILVWPYLVPSSLYSAAGRPLPTPSSALIGAQAVVSDAVAPAYMVAYTGGALGVLCAVICDGTTWFTH